MRTTSINNSTNMTTVLVKSYNRNNGDFCRVNFALHVFANQTEAFEFWCRTRYEIAQLNFKQKKLRWEVFKPSCTRFNTTKRTKIIVHSEFIIKTRSNKDVKIIL